MGLNPAFPFTVFFKLVVHELPCLFILPSTIRHLLSRDHCGSDRASLGANLLYPNSEPPRSVTSEPPSVTSRETAGRQTILFTPRIHRRITGLLSANSIVLTPFCANPNRQNPFPFVLISADRTHFLSCKRQQTELGLFCANINNRTHYLFPFVLTATGIICNA